MADGPIPTARRAASCHAACPSAARTLRGDSTKVAVARGVTKGSCSSSVSSRRCGRRSRARTRKTALIQPSLADAFPENPPPACPRATARRTRRRRTAVKVGSALRGGGTPTGRDIDRSEPVTVGAHEGFVPSSVRSRRIVRRSAFARRIDQVHLPAFGELLARNLDLAVVRSTVRSLLCDQNAAKYSLSLLLVAKRDHELVEPAAE